MSVVLICEKGQINASLEKFVDYLKNLAPTPALKSEDGTDVIPTEEKINFAEISNKGKQLLLKEDYAGLILHILTLDDLLFKESKRNFLTIFQSKYHLDRGC